MTTAGAVPLAQVAALLDTLLDTERTPDYRGAANGVQVANRAPIVRVAAAVDCSRATIAGAIAAGANLLIVHHGLFWGGAQPIVGMFYERLQLLFAHDVAVYSSHIPLDVHAEMGNNVLLARALDLEVTGRFGQYESLLIGVAGVCDLPTATLVARSAAFAVKHGGAVRVAGPVDARTTRRWAICTGAGVSSAILREAVEAGIDTLIVGEGTHHTAVEAVELGVTVIYAGHYATETLGVAAIAVHLESAFGLPWTFVPAPTGL
jgi:dinuclear metal center YbgI/SA1388 family protein